MIIKMGATYRDKITGLIGVATGFVTYISGCNQVLLQPPVDDKGQFVDCRWFDEQRLSEQSDPVIELDNGETPGHDASAPKR